ncbi:Spo0E family sporulation regulatory protein-aspartic acid phosphatase [Clostridium sp. DL1XJH146]
MIIDLLICRKRNQLDRSIAKNGLKHKKTLILSKQLGILITEKDKKGDD